MPTNFIRNYKKGLYVLLALISMAGPAHAANDCAFVNVSTGSIAFNSINPSLPGPVNNTVITQVLFTCNKNLTYTITASPASGWQLTSGANPPMPFSLNLAGPGLNVTNATQIALLTTTSSINQTNYQNAVGNGAIYNSGNITVTIAWTGISTGSITATVSARATILDMCAVSQAPGTLTFTMNPSIAGTTNATISPDMQIKCTKNNNVAITALSKCGGAASLLDSAYPACGGSTIPYTFNFLTGATGQGFGGTGISLNIGGSANSVNYENAAVGNYGDLQTLTITY
jgi:hypothetical protein